MSVVTYLHAVINVGIVYCMMHVFATLL